MAMAISPPGARPASVMARTSASQAAAAPGRSGANPPSSPTPVPSPSSLSWVRSTWNTSAPHRSASENDAAPSGASMALAPSFDLSSVPSSSSMTRSTSRWSSASTSARAGPITSSTCRHASSTPFPPNRLASPSRSSTASCSPVEAPDGTAARPVAPSASTTSASTVGFPRESSTSRARIRSMGGMGPDCRPGLSRTRGFSLPRRRPGKGDLLGLPLIEEHRLLLPGSLDAAPPRQEGHAGQDQGVADPLDARRFLGEEQEPPQQRRHRLEEQHHRGLQGRQTRQGHRDEQPPYHLDPDRQHQQPKGGLGGGGGGGPAEGASDRFDARNRSRNAA